VPPRTRRRASPRPAPVVHEDLYSEASLRASHVEANGHQTHPAKRQTRPEAASATPASAPTTAAATKAPTAARRQPGTKIAHDARDVQSDVQSDIQSDVENIPGDAPANDQPANDQSAGDQSAGDQSDDRETITDEDATDHPALAPPRPAPRRPGLIPTDIADTIGPVLGKAIADIKAHEDGSRRGGDIEDVHKMRVATRRLRAYLKAARPALDRTATDRLREDVKDLAGTLGVIRDHDVMIQQLHQEAAKLGDPDTGALEHLITRLDRERVAGRDQLITELDDPSYSSLLTELQEAAQQPPVADPWADLHELAAAEWLTLEKAHRKLHRRYGNDPPNDDLHELRIYGKRARYAAELLHERGSVAAFLEALAEFQEVLGNHQDACVLEDRLRELVEESSDPRAGIAAGRVIQGCHERRVAARAGYPAAWKKAAAAGAKAFAI